MNSQFLKDLVAEKILPDWAAERLDRLSTESKKEEAVEGIKAVLSDAVDSYCEKIENPAGKMLYQAPARAGVTPVSVSMDDKGLSSIHQIPWLRRWGLIAGGLWLSPVVLVLLYKVLSYPTQVALHFVSGYRSNGVWGKQQTAVTPILPNPHTPIQPSPSVPQITGATYEFGNKLRLSWDSLGEGYTYQVYRNCHPEDASGRPWPVAGSNVSTPGAQVNIRYNPDCLAPNIQVMAISPQGVPSELSSPVIFHVSLLNNEDSVEPLQEPQNSSPAERGRGGAIGPETHRTDGLPQGGRGMKPLQTPVVAHSALTNAAQPTLSSAPQPAAAPTKEIKPGDMYRALGSGIGKMFNAVAHPQVLKDDIPQVTSEVGDAVATHVDHASANAKVSAPAVSIPTGLAWKYIDANRIYLSWDSAGPGYTYNLFGSPAYPLDFTYNDPENDTPITETHATWLVPSGKGHDFIFELRAVDAQGHSSASSKRLVVQLP
jgi:hypothetical protein